MINSYSISGVQSSRMQLSLMARISPSTTTQAAVKFLVRDVWVLCLVLGVPFFLWMGRKALMEIVSACVFARNAGKFLHLSSYLQKNPENLYWLVVSFVGSRYMCVLSLFSFKLWHVSRLEL